MRLHTCLSLSVASLLDSRMAVMIEQVQETTCQLYHGLALTWLIPFDTYK